MRKWPTLRYKEEGMREGMQIEDANISVQDKVRLIDALSENWFKKYRCRFICKPKIYTSNG